MKRLILVLIVLTFILSLVVMRRPANPPSELAAAAPASQAASSSADPAAPEKTGPPEPIVIIENGQRISVPPRDVEPEAQLKPSDLDWEERPWEKPVEEILASSASPADKINSLLKVLETAPREGQVEVTHEIVALAAGSRDDLLVALLFEKTKHETVTSVILTELLKRANQQRLPVLLALAQRENHPNQEEAVELLELLLNKQHARDWAGWEASINEAIAAN